MGIKDGRSSAIGQLKKKFEPASKALARKEANEIKMKESEKDNNLEEAYKVFFIPLEDIELHQKQARSHHSEDHIRLLADSIKKEGLTDPIQVYKRKGKNGKFKYQVLSGEGRYKAHCLLKLPGIPCVVVEDERAAILSSVDTNEIRDDLHPVDRGRQFLVLDDAGFEEEMVLKRYGIAKKSYLEYVKFARQISKEVTKFLIVNNYYTMRTTRLVAAIADFYLKKNAPQEDLDELIIQSCHSILPHRKSLEPKDVEKIVGLSLEEVGNYVEIAKREARLINNDKELEKLEIERRKLQEQLDNILNSKSPKGSKKKYDTSTNVMKIQKTPEKGIKIKFINEDLITKKDYYDIALQLLNESLKIQGNRDEIMEDVMNKVGMPKTLSTTDSYNQESVQ